MTIVCRKSSDILTEKKTQIFSKDEEIIICAFCNNHVTDPFKQIMKDDSWYHTFANPYGCVFEIGCFSRAKGCISASASSNEFSWFPGFSWQVGVCNYCATHLGWIFSSESSKFFGLIIEKLIFP